jgi:hydrogenase maturation factor
MPSVPFQHQYPGRGLLNINPFGLIGSGSLLICCTPNYSQDLMNTIREAGIDIACIGEVMAAGEGISATRKGRKCEWPRFEADELTRLF